MLTVKEREPAFVAEDDGRPEALGASDGLDAALPEARAVGDVDSDADKVPVTVSVADGCTVVDTVCVADCDGVGVPGAVGESDVVAVPQTLSDAVCDIVVLLLAAPEPEAVTHAVGDAVGEDDADAGNVSVIVAESAADELGVPLKVALSVDDADERDDPEDDTEGVLLSDDVADSDALRVAV